MFSLHTKENDCLGPSLPLAFHTPLPIPLAWFLESYPTENWLRPSPGLEEAFIRKHLEVQARGQYGKFSTVKGMGAGILRPWKNMTPSLWIFLECHFACLELSKPRPLKSPSKLGG